MKLTLKNFRGMTVEEVKEVLLANGYKKKDIEIDKDDNFDMITIGTDFYDKQTTFYDHHDGKGISQKEIFNF